MNPTVGIKSGRLQTVEYLLCQTNSVGRSKNWNSISWSRFLSLEE